MVDRMIVYTESRGAGRWWVRSGRGSAEGRGRVARPRRGSGRLVASWSGSAAGAGSGRSTARSVASSCVGSRRAPSAPTATYSHITDMEAGHILWPSDPVTRESSDPETQLTRWPCSNSKCGLMCRGVRIELFTARVLCRVSYRVLEYSTR